MQYENMGDAIFRYSDHEGEGYLVLSPDDGWNSGHVGIRGPAPTIIELVIVHAITQEGGWIKFDSVIPSSSNDYAWTEWD